MRFLVFATLLLSANGSIHNYEAHAAQRYDQPQQKLSNKESDPYDPRQDRLYRLYLASTVLGVLGGIAGVAIIFWQVRLLRQTVDSSTEQSKAMESHVTQAARSANAMEKVVEVIESGNKAVMRAYLTAVVGNAIYQERRPDQGDLRFEGKPNLVNTGNTPARKVRIRISGDIIGNPIPNDFGFSLPEEDQQAGDATVAAHQAYVMSGVVKDFVPDAEVASIKEGVGKCLCVWGVVTYEDIFGDKHTTKFGQQITWLPNGTVYGIYIPGQNDTD